ncbi:hypothetical protein ACJBU6_10029 [Exserohilum turcicum]
MAQAIKASLHLMSDLETTPLSMEPLWKATRPIVPLGRLMLPWARVPLFGDEGKRCGFCATITMADRRGKRTWRHGQGAGGRKTCRRGRREKRDQKRRRAWGVAEMSTVRWETTSGEAGVCWAARCTDRGQSEASGPVAEVAEVAEVAVAGMKITCRAAGNGFRISDGYSGSEGI